VTERKADVDVVCVTGMHRSGTSMVARVVNLLGVDFGSTDEMLPAAADNPRGFWENQPIKLVNDRVLREFGGTWQRPPALPDAWQTAEALDPLRKEGVEVLASSFTGDTVGWKDPRTSLTLPFWRTVQPVQRAIVVLRNPHEVAASLLARNGFPTEKSARLWLRYTVMALLNAPDHLLVDYERCLRQTDDVLDEITSHLGLPPPDGRTRQLIVESVEPSLRHHGSTRFDGDAIQLAWSVHQLLVHGHPDQVRPLLRELAARWQPDAVQTTTATVHEQALQLTTKMADLQAQLLPVAAERDRLVSDVASTTRALVLAEQRATALEGARAGLEARAAQLDADLDRSKVERASLDRELGELRRTSDSERQRHQAALSASDAAHTKVADSLSSLQKRHEQLKRDHRRLTSAESVRVALWVAHRLRFVLAPLGRYRKRRAKAMRAGSSAGVSGTGSDRSPARREKRGILTPRTSAQPARTPTGAPSTAAQLRSWNTSVEALRSAPPVTVVIPIYNAVDAFRTCYMALLRRTTVPFELLLIDDASSDPAVGELLRTIAGTPHVTVLRNPENLGFTGTVNRGMRETSGDVVLLNSDTEVGPLWLHNLRLAAYSSHDIATATALTDNGGAFAVPEVGAANEAPGGRTFLDSARLVMQSSHRRYPETPTGNAFCMYVKRAALSAVGLFDEEHFPRGYGEENDFCMRARAAGWRHVVDDATLVAHARGASFQQEREELMSAGRSTVDRLHPEYTSLVRAFVTSPDMAAVRQTVRQAYDAAALRPSNGAPRVLFVIHEGGGGTLMTNADLMAALQPEYECFVLTSDTRTLRFGRVVDRTFDEIEALRLETPVVFGEQTRVECRELLRRVLVEHAIELVHVRHLFKHTFDAPAAAAELSLPVVMSFHDYYLSCPTVHLLDETDTFCGGTCTRGPGSCRLPSPWLETAPPLKHAFVHEWRAKVMRVLEHVDALVTTSPTAREVYRRSYPALGDKPFLVLEHGRDLEQETAAVDAPVPGGRIRIVVPGHLDVHKGAAFLAALKEADAPGRLDLHFLGRASEGVEALGTWHGTYVREEFPQRVSDIRPAFIGLFSVWAETYAHTLTEAWAAGLPVIATNIGALKERVEEHGGGVLIDHEDVELALKQIYAVADSPPEYARVREQATVAGLPTTADMAAAYSELYRSVLRRRQHVAGTEASSAVRGAVLRLDAHVAGTGAGHPGSVHVRTLRRLNHPLVAECVVARLDSGGRYRSELGEGDVVYVQRTAVDPQDVDSLLADCQRRSVPLVLDLDDHLLDLAGRDDLVAEYEPHAPGLRRMLSAAALVTASTPALVAALRGYARRVELVPNQLDERLWFSAGPVTGRPLRDDVRLLYMGTRTHGRDLALLRPAVERLREISPLPVRLFVVGVEAPGPGQEWYERIHVPAGYSDYPRFVQWLRSEAQEWDVAVAPLEDTRFNTFKSDLKHLEYSALGLPGVYSRSEAYASVVHDRTGLVVTNDTAAWVEALSRLLGDAELRARLAEEAYATVRQERTLGAHAQRYLELLFSAVAPPPLTSGSGRDDVVAPGGFQIAAPPV
jgi:GT2 family glycosyltransferase/glycosyltransferase involved in cell wall biosynthesis